MNIAADTASVAVLAFGGVRAPAALRDLPVHRAENSADPAGIDAAIGPYRRLVVVGVDADLAAVLSRLLRAERLDVEVAYAPRRRTPALLPVTAAAATAIRPGPCGSTAGGSAGNRRRGGCGRRWLPISRSAAVADRSELSSAALFALLHFG